MNFIRRLFSSKPKVTKAPDADQQLASLALQSADQCLVIATGTGSDTLRTGAIAKLDASTDLVKLAQDANPRIQAAARKRLGELIDGGQADLTSLLTSDASTLSKANLIAYASTQQAIFLKTITAQDELAEVASDGATSTLRQTAAELITDRAILEALCKRVQTKDKTVFKIVRSKLDAFKADDQEHKARITKREQLAEKLEKLSRLDVDNLYQARLQVLTDEWQQLAADSDPSERTRIEAALSLCQAQVAKRESAQAENEQQVQAKEQAQEVSEQIDKDAQALILELENLKQADEPTLTALSEKITLLQQASRLLQGTQISPNLHKVETYLHDLLTAYRSHGSLKQNVAALSNDHDLLSKVESLLAPVYRFYGQTLPEHLEESAALTKNIKLAFKNQQKAAQDALRDFSELIRKGLRAAEQGMVRKARGVAKEIDEKKVHFTSLPTGVENKLAELEAAIAKLADWHEFAVTPKKHALISEMQTLINSELPANDLATKIHSLQDDWKALSRGVQQQDDWKALSRGVQQQDESLWEQFQAASHEAFAPCKVYFDEQTQAREHNLAKRDELIAQVNLYLENYHWDTPIWKDVEQTLKVARKEWQSYWPVPRKASEAQQLAFDAVMDQLHGKLKAHFQANKQAKQALIEQAKDIAQQDNMAQMVEQIKQLQGQWKQVGKSYQKDDQHLWHEFRQHCDAVFARRAEAFDQQKAKRQAEAEQAVELIAKAEALIDKDIASLAQADDEINQLKRAFAELTQLPKEQANGLQQQFKRALSAINAKLASEQAQAEIQSWQDLFALSNDVRRYELSVLAGTADEALYNDIENTLNAPHALPANTLSLLQKRLYKAKQLQIDEQAERDTQLHHVVLRAEIFTGLASPETDRQARMEFQMSQLQRGLGQKEESIEQLLLEWISIGGSEDQYHQALFMRLMEATATFEGK